MTNLEFDVKADTTLADFELLLRELRLSPLWEIGGDDGSIQYDFTGHVWLLDLEDDEVKKAIAIIVKNPKIDEDSYVVIDSCDTVDIETLRKMVS